MKLGITIFIAVLVAGTAAGLALITILQRTKAWEKEAGRQITALHATVELSENYEYDSQWDKAAKIKLAEHWERSASLLNDTKRMLMQWEPWADKSDLQTALQSAEWEKKNAEGYLHPAAQ